MTLAEAAALALKAGIDISYFCYPPGLSIAACCRQCLVEVAGNPKLQPSCQMTVTEGMKVYTASEQAVTALKRHRHLRGEQPPERVTDQDDRYVRSELLADLHRRHLAYVPTMDIFEFLADTRAFVDRVLADPVVTAPDGLAKATVARYRSREYSDGYRQRYPNFENIRRRLPALRDNLRRLHAAGVPVALGTDMWAFPGLGVSIEMDLYARAGLSPLDALRAATRTAAESLGIDGDRGTLQPGKRADFLVLSDDPLRDVVNVRKIAAVYKNGEKAR